MIQYRHSIFETNSSSTHAMVVATNSSYIIPDSIHFGLGEYGWGLETLYDTDEKAAYLYTAAIILRHDDEAVQQALKDRLAEAGIYNVTFTTPKYEYYNVNEEEYKFLDNGAMDHAGEDDQYDFVDTMLSDTGMLLSYLFSDDSYVVIGNDNVYENERNWFIDQLNPDYPHETYYKGN